MIVFWILAGLFFVAVFVHTILGAIAYNRELRRYGAEVGPIVLRSNSPDDRDVLTRAEYIADLVEASANGIASRIADGVMVKGKRITFIHCIIFRDGYPTESWEDYLERYSIQRAAYVELFHEWLRTQADLPWYEGKVLKQNGAHVAPKFINYN
jgi:hypothetical protein